MKYLIRRLTPRPLRALVAKIGAFYAASGKVAWDIAPSQERSFATLRKLGWRPRSAIDVGAYEAEWSNLLLSVFPECRILMVEAQEAKKPLLEAACRRDARLSHEIALVGAADGPQVAFVAMTTGSSVYEEASAAPRERFSLPLARLDTVVARHPGLDAPQLLKIDTQGYELEVLKGAAAVLASVEVLLIEVSLVEVNKGAPLFAEVVAYVSGLGFRLFDVADLTWFKNDVLWQADLIFVRGDPASRIVAELNPKTWG